MTKSFVNIADMLPRRLIPGAILITTLVVGASQGQTQSAGQPLAERMVVASQIYALVQRYFAHWEGVDRAGIEAAYRAYIEEAIRTQSPKEFDLATLEFMSKLKNGHTQFVDSRADGRPLKFRLLEVEYQWVVLYSQDQRLPQGTVVKGINGESVNDFVRSQSRYVSASNDRLARTHVFSYPLLFPGQVALTLEDGNIVIIDRATPGDVQAAPPQGTQGRWLIEGRVAYIRVPSFGDIANEQTAVDLVRRFASSPNLIVDVRGNGGGTTPRQLIAALMNKPWRTWQESTPQSIALFDAQGVPPIQAFRPSRPQSPIAGAYAGRLFLLVDQFCGSACEDFVMPFKDNGRAVIVGETTQGSSGNPYRADLGGGMNVAIGAVRYRFPDGSPFEGIGIVPDFPVERKIADIANRQDAVLKRAQDLADAAPAH